MIHEIAVGYNHPRRDVVSRHAMSRRRYNAG